MRLRGLRRVVLPATVIVAALVSLLAWAASSPPGSSPDDDYHMASIWCASVDPGELCQTNGAPGERTLSGDLLGAASCFAFDSTVSASCLPEDSGVRPTTRGNWNGHSYPPVYYAVTHVFATDDLSVSTVLIRAFNVVLYLAMLTGLFFLLPRAARVPLVWGAVITAVPLGVFLIASINPSSWAIISATGLWAATWGFFVQHGWRRWALGTMTVMLVVIGAGSRGDSAAYAVLSMIVGAVLAFRRDRRWLLSVVLTVALTAAAALMFLTAGQSAVVGGATVVKNQTYTFTELFFINLKQLPQLLSGVFGTWGLGWLDTYLPGVVWVGALAVFSSVIFWGLRVGSWRKWLALGGTAAGVIGVPLFLLMHDGVVVGNGVQPRYVFPLMIVLAGVAVVGVRGAGLSFGRVQLVLVAGALVLANSIALHVNIRRYTTGLDVAGINLDRNIEWWWNAPVSPMGIWMLGTLAGAVVAALLVSTVWAPAPARAVAEALTAAERP